MESVMTETPITQVSSAENIRSILASLTEQSSSIKSLINNVRGVLKDVERQSKELDKMRNKKSRSKSDKALNGIPTTSGITKPVAISDELARFLGVEPGTLVPRNEVTKGVSAYVRKFELSDPTNKQKFVFGGKPEGEVLKTVLGNPQEDVTYFNLQRYLKHHYLPMEQSEKVVEPAKPVEKPKAESSEPAKSVEKPKAESSEPAKKKVVKIIKKPAQLNEEN